MAFTIFFYAVIYTMWLKRRTAQNIVIGGAAGALPPMIGWAAATGSIGLESVLLFLIIFFWTPPHFWALALLRAPEYARAGVPMLPVVAGADETRRQILIYAAILAPLGMSPALLGFAGIAYGAVAAVLGGLFLAVCVASIPAPRSRGRGGGAAAVRLLGALSLSFVRGPPGGGDRAMKHDKNGIVLTEEQRRRRRRRSLALALVLGVVVILFYAVTIVKLGPQVMNRPL